MKLMGKGKVSFEIPSKGNGALESIFRKVEELEQDKKSTGLTPSL
jgi:hypothetical protein